jgi:hypothetical protein
VPKKTVVPTKAKATVPVSVPVVKKVNPTTPDDEKS